MNLLLVRHAQSLNNQHADHENDATLRHPDPPLTEVGHTQARALAHWLGENHLGQRVTHLYSSLMTRAVQTAAPLAQTLNLPVLPVLDAFECGGISSGPLSNFTPLPGGTHDTLREHCPALLWPPELGGQAWPGGCEPWEPHIFQARARKVATQLRETAPDAELIILVTHHDFSQYLLTELLKLPDDKLLFPLNNTSTTLIQQQLTRRVLHWSNRTDHLTPDLITY